MNLVRSPQPVVPQPRPPLALVLEAPRAATSVILGRTAPWFLCGGRRLFVADGANCFDPYAFSQEARRRGLREDVLDRVFVSRAFTIHQLAAVSEHLLRPLQQDCPGAVVAMLGLDHLFLEESLRVSERARVLRGVLADLGDLRRGRMRLLVTHEAPPRGQGWWRPMLEFGDVRARALEQADGGWTLRVTRCRDGADIADVQHMVAGGDRFVEGVSPGPEGGAEDGV